jgi:hypothetical protein
MEHGILRESFKGKIDYNDLQEANTTIISNPNFKKGLNFLTDLRKTEISIDYVEMISHVSNLPDLGIKKQAFIVDSDFEFAMARMFEMLSENEGLYDEARVFNDLEKGLEWLSS